LCANTNGTTTDYTVYTSKQKYFESGIYALRIKDTVNIYFFYIINAYRLIIHDALCQT